MVVVLNIIGEVLSYLQGIKRTLGTAVRDAIPRGYITKFQRLEVYIDDGIEDIGVILWDLVVAIVITLIFGNIKI